MSLKSNSIQFIVDGIWFGDFVHIVKSGPVSELRIETVISIVGLPILSMYSSTLVNVDIVGLNDWAIHLLK